MERNNEFNIQEQIDHWVSKIKSEPSFTESDSEELKSHFLDSIDKLKDTGLNDEEAFWVASRRIGTTVDWEEDFSQVNNQVIQMRRSILILAGVLLYFCLYYFIEFTSRLLFIILLSENINGYLAVNWVSRYLIGAHFVIIIIVASIYFMEKRTVSFIENIKMKPKHAILLLLTTIIFGITDTCLFPVARNLTGQDNTLRSHLIHIYLYFNYSFPLIICVSFIFLYFKYYRKTKF
ncbi:MAG TPA: hypothetical protein VIK14_07575 [Ignavibacteria bacterium]